MKYELIRSKRKTISLEITGAGKIVVRAPESLSEKCIEDFVNSHTGWIERHLKRISERRPEPPETAEELDAMKRALQPRIMPLVEHYSKLMHLYPSGVKITSARTRFGSCSGKNSICFSCRLMNYPDAALEYVVVHELAHIKYHNHSSAFYRLIAMYLPDHKQRRALLRSAPILDK